MKNKIRIAGIFNDSLVDGPGVRLSIFMQGCPHACQGCHNPNTWDKNGGYLVNLDDIVSKFSENKFLDGITLTGGDPLIHVEKSLYLAKKAKKHGLNIIIYTGFLYEDLIKKNDKNLKELFKISDVLIDGPFIIKLHDKNLKWRGSSNQRIIALKESLESNKIIEIDDLYNYLNK